MTGPVRLPAAPNYVRVIRCNGGRTLDVQFRRLNVYYFLSIGDHQAFQVHRSRNVSGIMQAAEKLAFSSPATADVDPEIAADQSFLVFASAGRRGKDNAKEHLYMVRSDHGTWGSVTPIRYERDDANGSSSDNEPSLNHGGDTLYFSSDRTLAPFNRAPPPRRRRT